MRKKIGRLIVGLFIYSFVCALLGYLIHIEMDYTPNLELSFKEVFLNNLEVNYTAIFLSIISFGLYGPFFVGKEMFFLGVIIRSVAEKETFLRAFSFISFHSIIEIPTMILSGAIGIIFWILIWDSVKKKKVQKDRWRFFALLIAAVFCLTLIAAIVETTVTKAFVRNLITGGAS